MRCQEYVYPQFFTYLSIAGISIQIYPANAIASSFIRFPQELQDFRDLRRRWKRNQLL